LSEADVDVLPSAKHGADSYAEPVSGTLWGWTAAISSCSASAPEVSGRFAIGIFADQVQQQKNPSQTRLIEE